jgi:hypothetical protein
MATPRIRMCLARQLAMPMGKRSHIGLCFARLLSSVPGDALNALEQHSLAARASIVHVNPEDTVRHLISLRNLCPYFNSSESHRCLMALLPILAAATDFRISDRQLVFAAATDVLVPLVHAEMISLTDICRLLWICAEADILSVGMLESCLPSLCAQSLDSLSYGQLCIIGAVYSRMPVAANKLVANVVQEVTRRFLSEHAVNIPITMFLAASLASAGIRSVAFMEGLAPSLSSFLVSQSFHEMDPADAINCVHTIADAFAQHCVVVPDVMRACMTHLLTSAAELERRMNKAKYLDAATSTKVAWLVVSAAYAIVTQMPALLQLPDTRECILVATRLCKRRSFMHERTAPQHTSPVPEIPMEVVTRLYRLQLGLALVAGEPSSGPRTSADLHLLGQQYDLVATTKISSAQRDVYKRLCKLAQAFNWPPPQLEAKLDCRLSVDVLLSLPKEWHSHPRILSGLPAGCRGVVVEVDGPFHFLFSHKTMASQGPILVPKQQIDAGMGSSNESDLDEYVSLLFGDAIRPHPGTPQCQTQTFALKDDLVVNMGTMYHRWMLRKLGYQVVPLSFRTYFSGLMGKSGADGQQFLTAHLTRVLGKLPPTEIPGPA